MPSSILIITSSQTNPFCRMETLLQVLQHLGVVVWVAAVRSCHVHNQLVDCAHYSSYHLRAL